MSERRLMSELAPKKPGAKEAAPALLSEPRSGFNLLEWVQGVRPIRRVVTLYQRLDLLADRDMLGSQLQDARLAGDEDLAEGLRTQIRALTDKVKESAVNVTLAGVTTSRYQEILDEAKAAPEVVTAEDVVAYQIAAQIVEPEGFTYEVVKMLDEQMPVQMGKVGTAWAQINTTTPDVEATIPF